MFFFGGRQNSVRKRYMNYDKDNEQENEAVCSAHCALAYEPNFVKRFLLLQIPLISTEIVCRAELDVFCTLCEYLFTRQNN